MTSQEQKVVLVTGASTGFGRLTAELLARQGHTVYASMRNVDAKNAEHASAIETVARTEDLDLHVIELDVTEDESVNRAVSHIVEKSGRVDVAINNAAIGGMGPSEAFTSDQALAYYQANVLGPPRVNRAVLPHMRQRRRGLLVHISSTAGRIALPFMGHYSATKFALEALAEAYRYELAGLGVDSVIVEPGAFPTPAFDKIEQPADGERVPGYGPNLGVLQTFGENVGSVMMGPNAPDPAEVARAVADLIATPAGERRLRTVVGDVFTAPVGGDDGITAARRGLFEVMGAGHLLDGAVPVA